MTDPVTAEEIAELRAASEAATPGPWFADDDDEVGRKRPGDDMQWVASCRSGIPASDESNARFIALARNLVSGLITDIERLQAEVARLRGPGILHVPLPWEQVPCTSSWRVRIGPYLAEMNGHESSWAWKLHHQHGTERNAERVTSRAEADRQVREAIRAHLEHAGLVLGAVVP